MDLKGFVEKAKDAAIAAGEKAREVAATATQQATGSTPPEQGAAPDQAAPKSFATLTAEKLAEFKDIGSEKISGADRVVPAGFARDPHGRLRIDRVRG